MKFSDMVAFLDGPHAFDLTYDGHKVEYLNEAGAISDRSRFFVAGHEFGACVVVHVEAYRGVGFEAAWGAWIDSRPTIPEDELVEAYGPPGTPDGSFIDMAHAEARDDNPPWGSPGWDAAMVRIRARAREMLVACDEPDLIEGYEYQENASGTGIVDVGHYSWMTEADLGRIEIVRKEES